MAFAAWLLASPAVAAPSTAPAAPSQVRAAALDDDKVRLRWQDNSCDESAFILQVSDGGAWRNVPHALDADSTAVILTGLEPSTTYRFRLVAASTGGLSEPSAAAEVRTFAADGGCQVAPHRLCLGDGRFAVTALFEPAHYAGASEPARAVPDGPNTGSFWFFDPSNLELSVEMIDGGAVNGHVWITADGLSNLEYRLHVRDTVTGAERFYVNPTNDLCGVEDRFAFELPVAPPPQPEVARLTLDDSSAPVEPGFERDTFRGTWRAVKVTCGGHAEHRLPLLGGRFLVGLDYRGDDGVVRPAAPRRDSLNSGFFTPGDGSTRAEWAVKILDGRDYNQHFWLFWTPMDSGEAWLRVTDTVTGEERRLYNARGAGCSRHDTLAFEGEP